MGALERITRMPKDWIITPDAPDKAVAGRRWGVPPLVAQLLLNRGLTSTDSAADFLTPQLRDLLPPEQLPGAREAAECVVEALHAGKKIVLYGDYDVDGTTGVAILLHVLRQAGAQVSYYVPHRVEEGYGLNRDALEKLADEGAQLIVTIDCGIRAAEVAEVLREKQVPLIVTDHHLPGAKLPPAEVLVHPTVGGDYANPHLCGAGVAFKLAWIIAQRLSGAERVTPAWRALLMDLLPLAALGTIADVVPLVGENRIIARHGLAHLPQTPWPGVRALIESAGLEGANISGYDVGFKLAPRLNAAGRMGHARLAVELLTDATEDRAREIALYLEDHNRKRQATERRITREASEIIDAGGLASDARRGIVLAGKDWHAGVIGIVAARLVERYHRPVVLIALDGAQGQGSGRSITHFDLFAALDGCREHLLTCGGHAQAAGLRIAAEKVDDFTDAFVNVANQRLTGADMVAKLRLDACVTLDELTLPTAEAIAGLGPFGIDNPQPLFATDWLELAGEPRVVGKDQNHLQVTFAQHGVQLKGIGFGLAELAEDLKEHRRCQVAFEPIINDFNSRRSVELRILDLRFPP